MLNPLSLWHAAELLIPLTDASRHAPDIVAAAHAWRGQMLFAVTRTVSAQEELQAAAAIDPSIGLPLAAWTPACPAWTATPSSAPPRPRPAATLGW